MREGPEILTLARCLGCKYLNLHGYGFDFDPTYSCQKAVWSGTKTVHPRHKSPLTPKECPFMPLLNMNCYGKED
jgi:hypothetical protein